MIKPCQMALILMGFGVTLIANVKTEWYYSLSMMLVVTTMSFLIGSLGDNK